MEYVSAGIGSFIFGLGLAFYTLYLLARKVMPIIRRIIKRVDTEAQEVRDIRLEDSALRALCRIGQLTIRKERQRGIDALYANGLLPSYVPDGMRNTGAIITVILNAQLRRSRQPSILQESADRPIYVPA